MGRLKKQLNEISTINIDEQSGTTNDVHIFIDDNGNVTQIKKVVKDRIKYCIEENIPQSEIIQSCVIGVSDPIEGDCTNGVGLGFGDIDYGYAIYDPEQTNS